MATNKPASDFTGSNNPNSNVTDTTQLTYSQVFDTGYVVIDGQKQPLIAGVVATTQDVNIINEKLIYDHTLSTPKTINNGTAQFEAQFLNGVSNLDPFNKYKQPTISKFQYNVFINQKFQGMLSYDIATKMTRTDWMSSVAKGMTNIKAAAGDATNLSVLDHATKVGLAYGQFWFTDFVQNLGSNFDQNVLWGKGTTFQVPNNVTLTTNLGVYALNQELNSLAAFIPKVISSFGAVNASIPEDKLSFTVSPYFKKNITLATQGFVGSNTLDYTVGNKEANKWINFAWNPQPYYYLQNPRPKVDVETVPNAQYQASFGFNNIADYTYFKNVVGVFNAKDGIMSYTTPQLEVEPFTGTALLRRLGFIWQFGCAVPFTRRMLHWIFLDSQAYFKNTGTAQAPVWTPDYETLLADMTQAQAWLKVTQPSVYSDLPELPTVATGIIPNHPDNITFEQWASKKSLLQMSELVANPTTPNENGWTNFNVQNNHITESPQNYQSEASDYIPSGLPSI